MESRMIPRWQMVGLIVLAFIAIGLGIYSSPNSYAHLFLSGQCNHEPMPLGCHTRSLGHAP